VIDGDIKTDSEVNQIFQLATRIICIAIFHGILVNEMVYLDSKIN
jgi:hypothetical protein